MIHAVRIANGKATYCNRWVQTSRLQQEGCAGWPLVPKSEPDARRQMTRSSTARHGGRVLGPGGAQSCPRLRWACCHVRPCRMRPYARPAPTLAECPGSPLATVGDSRGASLLALVALRRLAEKLGVLDSRHGTGTANTAVAFHAGRVRRVGAAGPAPGWGAAGTPGASMP